jgi:hypothetical protein
MSTQAQYTKGTTEISYLIIKSARQSNKSRHSGVELYKTFLPYRISIVVVAHPMELCGRPADVVVLAHRWRSRAVEERAQGD